jgi:septum formation protein
VKPTAAPDAPPLLLASTSPRRVSLLREAGYRFRQTAPRADEDIVRDLPARAQAETLARAKAQSVRGDAAGEIVLGADTVVAVGERTLGKPADDREAAAILKAIRGRHHSVITGLCLIDPATGRERVDADETALFMKPVSDAEIEAYVNSGESAGKAGAYAMQETGDRFVTILEGSYSNVVGLPLELLAKMLAALAAG